MSSLSKQSIVVDGESFTYLAAGDSEDPGCKGGKPLILCLHGFPDHAPSFSPVIKGLAAHGFRAIAPWMRGYSPSVAAGPYHADRLARDVIALSRALSPDHPVALVGHDWGAVATYAALAEAPDCFHSAVTLAVPHPLAFLGNLKRQPGQLYRSWYMLFFQLPAIPERITARRDFALIDRLWRMWSPGYRLPGDARRALHQCLANSMPAPLHYYRALARPLGSAARRIRSYAQHRITTPTLHLHGADDGCIAAALGRGQERFFAGPFSSQVIASAGHFLPVEVPDEIVKRTVEWVTQWDRQ